MLTKYNSWQTSDGVKNMYAFTHVLCMAFRQVFLVIHILQYYFTCLSIGVNWQEAVS
jgi:hypothetical protein